MLARLLGLMVAAWWTLATIPALPVPLLAAAEEKAASGDAAETKPAAEQQQAEAKRALQAAQHLIGSWRGVGQVRRGSTAGSWQEETNWAWQFEQGSAALVFAAPQGKHFVSGRLLPGKEQGTFLLEARRTADAKPLRYQGTLEDEGPLVLTAEGDVGDAPARLTFRTVAGGDRLVVLLERRLGDSDRFLRLAEIGYTRQGSKFGQGGMAKECVVTGGAGTIAVTHNGQTYYVCCTGCRDYFYADPQTVLAEYQAKKAAQQAKE
jgi:hypothetical protein